MAEVAISKNLFAESLRMIAEFAASAGRINWLEGQA